MENATKAIYMAAGMMIAVMVLGVWVYMFRVGGRFSENYEFQESVEQLQAFNAKFEIYNHKSIQSNNASDGYSFKDKGNSPSDVISCASLAYDINRKNDFDETNSVKVIVKIGSNTYYIHPVEQQRQNCFISNMPTVTGTVPDSRFYSFNNFLRDYNSIRIVNVTSANYNSSAEAIYQYYFDVLPGGITYSDRSGKVDSVTFTMNETENFNNTTCWHDV